MFEEPIEETIQQDLEQEAYERKKVSLKRLTIFVLVVDFFLAIYVIIQLLDFIAQRLNP
jgi:hypothetical protein